MNFSPDSFGLGFAVGLILLAIIWLIVDRAALKAKLAALEAKAAPAVNRAIAGIEHDAHMVEAGPKVVVEDIKDVLSKYFADLKAETARIEAAKAAPPAPAATPAPAAPPA